MLMAAGRFEMAADLLERAWPGHQTDPAHLLSAITLHEAWLAHRQRDLANRDARLRDSLRLANDSRSSVRLRWYPMNGVVEVVETGARHPFTSAQELWAIVATRTVARPAPSRPIASGGQGSTAGGTKHGNKR